MYNTYRRGAILQTQFQLNCIHILFRGFQNKKKTSKSSFYVNFNSTMLL